MKLGRSKPRVHLLIVQPTPFCNINCSYCYLAGRSNRATIGDQTLENLFAKLFRAGWADRRLDVAWHAGEPTVLPIEFYRRAFAILDRYRPRDVEVTHGFQTNAILLNSAWCDFFRANRVSVGVSIDGPERINDLHRVDRAGRGTFAKVVAGIRLLRAEGVRFHVITVLSSESLRSAKELYAFYAEEGIEHVGFNVEETEGEHVSSMRAGPPAWTIYRDFLAEFASLAARDGRVKTIREIDHGVRVAYRNPFFGVGASRDLGPHNVLVEPFNILSMDCEGNLATFSPELLGHKNARYNDFVIGNVNADAFEQLPQGAAFQRMHADIQAGVALCREQCGYFDMCGGGEPANKIAENGTFVSSATNFCHMTRMAVADLMLNGPHAS
jgi:uncharacterized protein